MTTSNDVRDQLIEALRLDLVGHLAGHHPRPPRGRAAFVHFVEVAEHLLASSRPTTHPQPARRRRRRRPARRPEPQGRSRRRRAPEAASADKELFPSSIGLSVLVSAETRHLRVKLAWGEKELHCPVRGSEANRGSPRRREATWPALGGARWSRPLAPCLARADCLVPRWRRARTCPWRASSWSWSCRCARCRRGGDRGLPTGTPAWSRSSWSTVRLPGPGCAAISRVLFQVGAVEITRPNRSCRGPIVAARMARTGTRGSPTSNTATRSSTRWGTASRRG